MVLFLCQTVLKWHLFLPFVTVESLKQFCSMVLSVATLFKDNLCHSSTQQYMILRSLQTVSSMRNSFSNSSIAISTSSVSSIREVCHRLITVVPPKARLLQTVTLIPADSPTAKLLSWLFLRPIQRDQSELLLLLIRITPNIFCPLWQVRNSHPVSASCEL